ncbi:MAG: hypothetical protein FD141_1494 [Fusobacteria bacterium]|nr:MAG: hypothetical protein FD141_1494 [Fusobacteriota bacterium]KAF0230207.1 MAG: hypothetical protein FD182_597 [Fusobacteriota bacterium]
MFKKNMFLAFILFFVLLFVSVTIYYLIVSKAPKNNIPSIKRTEIATIMKIIPSGDYGTFYIERDVYQAYVTIDEKTIITDSKNTKELSYSDLKLGDSVEVTVPEMIIEIYPYQYVTERIVLLD